MTPLSARMRQIGIGRKSLVHIRPLVLRGCQSPTRLDGGLAMRRSNASPTFEQVRAGRRSVIVRYQGTSGCP